MADPSSPIRSSTTLVDLDIDSLSQCASYLSLQDVSNMAMSCKHLNQAAYSDSLWQSLYRLEWPHVGPAWSLQESSIREAFLSRHTALRQFKYADPHVHCGYALGNAPQHMLFNKNGVIYSKGTSVGLFPGDDLVSGIHGNHNARITCMRLFSLSETSLYKGQFERDDDVLITSSADRCIRLSWKGGNRCFRGHTGPVTTLSDGVLGDEYGKIFASGGDDRSVRLWSLNSSGKRGQQTPKATLYGHRNAVSLIAVSGYKSSLFVSISKDGKVIVWDTNAASSSTRSSCSVGTTVVPSAPVRMKCHESLLYVASGSSVVTVDLRTMKRVSTLMLPKGICSFEALPSKFLYCTGGNSSSKLWDIRRICNEEEPIAEMGGHVGPVKHIHMDSYKIVTGGPSDPHVNVWAADTAVQTNSLSCADTDFDSLTVGCSAMAVDGCRIVTGSTLIVDQSYIVLRDFTNSICDILSNVSETSAACSKFWSSQSDIDSESGDLGWED